MNPRGAGRNVEWSCSRGATEESSPRRKPWVKRQYKSSPGRGERDLRRLVFCRPYRGLDGLATIPTVSPWAIICRASGAFIYRCWCANLFPAGRRRVQRRRGSSRSRNRGGVIYGLWQPVRGGIFVVCDCRFFIYSSVGSGIRNMSLLRSLRFWATGDLQRCRA
jgi:hypothetical protein